MDPSWENPAKIRPMGRWDAISDLGRLKQRPDPPHGAIFLTFWWKNFRKFQSNLVGNLQFLKIPKNFFVPHSNGRCMIPSNSIYHWPHPKIGCLNPEFPSVAEKSALANPRFFGSEIWKPWVFHRVFHFLFFFGICSNNPTINKPLVKITINHQSLTMMNNKLIYRCFNNYDSSIFIIIAPVKITMFFNPLIGKP